MKKLRIFTLLLTICFLMTACGAKTPEQDDPAADDLPVQTGGQESGISTDSEMFTDRDLRTTYDASTAATVTLTGSGAACSSDAVKVQGSTVTILDEGTYLLTGELTGQIIVDAPDDAKTQIVLQGAAIHSDTSAALYVREADKVVVTLEGENTLSCGDSFTAIDENNIDGAVYAKSDLTFNGSGSLTVSAPAGHGVVAKDDLVFAGGTYAITSASHGVDANDSVRCVGAALTIDAGKDAIHAENSDDTSLGFIYIDSGSFALEAEGDGLSAASTMIVLDGSFDILCGGGSENGTKQT